MARDLPPIPPDDPNRHRRPERLGRGNDRPADRPKPVNLFAEFEAANPEYSTGDLDTFDTTQDNDPDHRPDDPGTGWYARGVRYHPDRPDLDSIRLTPDRHAHIIDGDENGGGHLFGTGEPGKNEFPRQWGPDDIADAVYQAARYPHDVYHQRNGRWHARGTVEAVEIETAVNPDGRIWSAWPTDGPGVVHNPSTRGGY